MGSTNPPRKRNHPACDESDHPAAKKQIAGTSKDGKAQQANTARISSPKPPCQPLGNLLARENAYNARDAGLGRLAVLPDEILIGIVGELEALDLMRIQAVSHALFAFSRIEGQWKHLYVRKTAGKLERWQGTWRATYLRGFCNSPQTLASGLPTDHINISDIYSDALYLPYMAARYDANDIASSSKFANNVKRMDGSALSVDDLGDEPLILTNLMDQWAALQEPGRWSLSSLAKRFPSVVFRAEAVLTKLSDYIPYHNDCTHDESPLYIFDANFVEKTEASDPTNGLQQDFAVPHLFQDDLFSVLGEQRPNFRWLVCFCSFKLSTTLL